MKQTIDTYSIEGKVTGKVELPAEIFNVEYNQELIALALRVFMANQRQGTSKAKSRGEINKTGHKIWKQKGTGRARHGDKGAPIFVGGGVAHGPSGDQNYKLSLPKRMKNLALKGAFSQALKTDQIMVVEGLDTLKTSTKEFIKMVNNLKLSSTNSIFMLESALPNVIKAGRNVQNISITQAKRTNIFELLNAQKIIIQKTAIEALVRTFAPESQSKGVNAVSKATKKTAK